MASCHHVLMRMTENWKNALDNKKVIAVLSMDLSKTFDCLHHDLIIAKLHAYGFEIQALKLTYSYLSNRFQSVRVKDTYSSANKVKSAVPQGSLLGVILFNIQFNDIFDIMDEAELYNYGAQGGGGVVQGFDLTSPYSFSAFSLLPI